MSNPVMSNKKAIGALLTAVLALSLLPLNLELTLKDSNPFVFVTIQTAAMIVSLTLYLFVTARKRFDTTKLSDIVGPAKNLLVNSHTGQTRQHESLPVWIGKTVLSWLRTPFLWAVIVGLEYSLFGWSILYIDAAVTTIIYGLWPLITIYALVYLSKGTEGSEYHIYFQKKVLTVLALIGLIIVVIGSIEDNQSLLHDPKWLLGILIAMLAALLNGMNPAMSIHFSDLLYQRTPHPKPQSKNLIAQQKLWLSIYAVTVGRFVSMPVNLIIGFTVGSLLFEGQFGITPLGLAAAIISGMTLLPAASILLRLANLSISDLSINAICYAEPALTSLWLAFFTDIDVPKFNLFLVGAGIIVVTNVLIQVIPDINLGNRPHSDIHTNRSS